MAIIKRTIALIVAFLSGVIAIYVSPLGGLIDEVVESSPIPNVINTWTGNDSATDESSSGDRIAQKEEPITWKAYRNQEGLFTVMYPSNWIPVDALDVKPPLNIMVKYQGNSTGEPEVYLYITDYKEEEYVNGSQVLLDRALEYYNSTTDNFNLTSPIECQKYTISGIAACSAIASYTELAEPSTSLYVMGADVYSGSEYLMQFVAQNPMLFDHFFPTVESMIRSFMISETSLSQLPSQNMTSRSKW